MLLHSPVEITSRLLPGVRVGGASISIEYAGHREGRQVYRWFIDLDGQEFTDDDLKSGAGGGSLQDGLESLLTFLAACGEAVAYSDRSGHESENCDLFPREVAEWAAANRDELSVLAYELEETENAIQE